MKSVGIAKTAVALGIAVVVCGMLPAQNAHAQIDGGSLNPSAVDKYVAPLIIPPAMPRTGRDQRPKGREEDRLLRDRGAPVRAADPAARDARDHGLELRLAPGAGNGGTGWQLQLPGLHHRSEVPAAGAGEVDQRPGGCQRQLPAPPAAGGPDPALGEPGGHLQGRQQRNRLPRNQPRTLHRAGAHDHPRPRRRHLRVVGRLPRGLVPAGREEHPGGDPVHIGVLLRHVSPTNPRSAASGSPVQRSSSTPTT